jgi:hypothetical protein
MAIFDPDHFFDQGDRLTISPRPGPTRQVDLRRAVSSAYYGVFHFTCAALGDYFVGATHRSSPRHALVYRSIDHRALRELCQGIVRATPPPKLARYLPSGGLGRDMVAFCGIVPELQDRRHRADYDPTAAFTRTDGHAAVTAGRSAVRRFRAAPVAERAMFLTLLLCPPR